jgi:DNA-binding NarL/FixJ family response regulator
MAADWPLIGRDVELARVAAVLARPEATGVVLVGSTGVGKTRLAAECLRLGAESGFATAQIVASRAASTIPFGALAPLLPPGAIALERGLNPLRQATRALTELAAGKPLLLLVDDAHTLDDPSAALLQQLAASRAAFLVVTLRADERPPESITALWKDHGVERIVVEPLSRDGADRLVTTMLDGDVEPSTLGLLWAKTHGNALFLRELVVGAVEAGALANRGGWWHRVGDLAPSGRLSELVELRLSGLTKEEVEALEFVAFGEPLGVEVLTELTDARVVEDLERRGLLTMIRDGRRFEIRLAHPMYGEVLRLRTPALRARSVSRMLAEAIEARSPQRRGDALQVSLLRLDGGGTPPLDLLLAATAQARFANDTAVAHRLAQITFDLAPSFDSGMMLADVLYESDKARECVATLRMVAPMVETKHQLAVLARARASAHFWKMGDAEEATRLLLEALDQLNDPLDRDEVSSFLALIDVQAGQPLAALDRMADAINQGSGRSFVLASLSCAFATAITGRCVDAIDMADRAFELRVEMGSELSLFQAGLLLIHKAAALNEAGRIAESLETGEFIRSVAADSNDVSGQGFSSIALARTCVIAGKLLEAKKWAAEATELLRRWGHGGPLRWGLGYLALSAAMSGDLQTASDAVSELDVLPSHPGRMLEIDIVRGRAWTAVLEGRPEEGRAMLREVAEEMNKTGQASFEAAALFDLARLGESTEVAARLTEIASIGQSQLHATMARAASALARSSASDLATSAAAFAAMGAMLFAAETAVAAADAYRRSGDQRRAAEWSRRAHELAAQCEGAQTPGLVLIDAPVPLTQREREIAILAVQGLTSKAIGERLYVTSRTVDNHLARIYLKLGITRRSELAVALATFE